MARLAATGVISGLNEAIADYDAHFLGGLGRGCLGKNDRLVTFLHVLLDGNVVVRIRHKGLFSQRGGLDVAPLLETVLGDITARSGLG
ncbi:MAG: hypothetical protein AAGI14_08240 [Pseudomonadota bacterium]